MRRSPLCNVSARIGAHWVRPDGERLSDAQEGEMAGSGTGMAAHTTG